MKAHRRYLVRNLDDEGYLEAFLVSAIAAILLLRFYLYLAGFPQVGGKGLHIAHTLWGGLLMLVALAIVFNYLDRESHRIAAIIGGAGFGLFIDELGKFITSDTNYFYQPAAAIIYIILIVVYLIFRLLERERNVTDQEYLVNSIETFKQALIRGYDRAYIEKALLRLEHAGGSGEMYHHLRQTFEQCPDELPSEPGLLSRLRQRSRRLYAHLIGTSWFPRAIILFFLLEAILTLLVAIIATWRATGFNLMYDPWTGAGARMVLKQIDVIFAGGASVLVILGALAMVRSRMQAYRMFKLAMLVSIFLTQIFEFYTIQFVALFGVGFNVLGLMLVDMAITRERERLRHARAEKQLSA